MPGSFLPKDVNIRKEEFEKKPIQNVSDYIERINHYMQARGSAGHFCVYRGEPEIYPTPCMPGIFRRGILSENRFFEKNLFDAMRQNKLTDERRYLNNAIDAQHGTFPSRLLDVSYNCLTALYFAVTPYFHKEEEELDGVDGMVFLFFLNDVFSPSAQNTNDNYDAIVNRDKKWCQEPVFQKNIKFIDHTKLNSRIIAQQGAFILFQGDEPEELPKGMFYGIQIPGGAKKEIRGQLRQLFGIHTGSIYPETDNLVKELTDKSKYLNTKPFTCEHELRYTLGQLEKELDFYLDYAVSQRREPDADKRREEMQLILAHIERVINGYREGLLHFVLNKDMWKEVIQPKALQGVVEDYNRQLEKFSGLAAYYELGYFLGDDLKLDPGLCKESTE